MLISPEFDLGELVSCYEYQSISHWPYNTGSCQPARIQILSLRAVNPRTYYHYGDLFLIWFINSPTTQGDIFLSQKFINYCRITAAVWLAVNPVVFLILICILLRGFNNSCYVVWTVKLLHLFRKKFNFLIGSFDNSCWMKRDNCGKRCSSTSFPCNSMSGEASSPFSFN